MNNEKETPLKSSEYRGEQDTSDPTIKKYIVVPNEYNGDNAILIKANNLSISDDYLIFFNTESKIVARFNSSWNYYLHSQ